MAVIKKKKNIVNVPEDLYVHMNEIYKKLTTIKSNKFEFKKIFLIIAFSFSKVHFSLLAKKSLSKKSRFYFHYRSHKRSELLAHILQYCNCNT